MQKLTCLLCSVYHRDAFLGLPPTCFANCPVNMSTASCKVLSWLLTSAMAAPSLLKMVPLDHWLAIILCLMGLTCAIFFYLAKVLSLNSLFWMNPDFVTWSLLYNEMQTMERLNQFTKKKSICQTVWRCSQFRPAAHAVLDKGAKHLAVRQMKLKASGQGCILLSESLL